MSTTPHKRNPMGATIMTNQKTRTNSLAGEQVLTTRGASSMSAASAPIASTGPKKTFIEEQSDRDPMVAAAVNGIEASANSLHAFNFALEQAVKLGQRADAWQYDCMNRLFAKAKQDLAKAEELMTRLSRMTDC